jgi:hypothetical protein
MIFLTGLTQPSSRQSRLERSVQLDTPLLLQQYFWQSLPAFAQPIFVSLNQSKPLDPLPRDDRCFLKFDLTQRLSSLF